MYLVWRDADIQRNILLAITMSALPLQKPSPQSLSDAVSEIGAAMGDACMHYSQTHNGAEYAEQVTKVSICM
jgi:hypothetical protein